MNGGVSLFPQSSQYAVKRRLFVVSPSLLVKQGQGAVLDFSLAKVANSGALLPQGLVKVRASILVSCIFCAILRLLA